MGVRVRSLPDAGRFHGLADQLDKAMEGMMEMGFTGGELEEIVADVGSGDRFEAGEEDSDTDSEDGQEEREEYCLLTKDDLRKNSLTVENAGNRLLLFLSLQGRAEDDTDTITNGEDEDSPAFRLACDFSDSMAHLVSLVSEAGAKDQEAGAGAAEETDRSRRKELQLAIQGLQLLRQAVVGNKATIESAVINTQ